MSTIPLRVEFPALPAVQSRTLRFILEGTVSEACRLIRENNPEADGLGLAGDFGIYARDTKGTSKQGYWLDEERPLSFYKMVRPMSSIQYRKKLRPLRVKMMDAAVKMIMANDAAPISTIMKQICERVGISNWESYSLVMEDTQDDRVMTMKRRESLSLRNAKKMEKLRSMLHTEDGVNWVNHDKSLSEQGVTEDMILTLRVKFWGDSNIDRNDPVHLNLIFAEAREFIIQGTHPVTEDEAVAFAAIHAQEQYGNYDSTKLKLLHSYIRDLLPPDYRKVRGIEQRVISEYSKLTGLSEHNSRFRYVDLFRSLRTFGVSFFLVKEKQPGKNRLVPRLLGIARDSIMRVDENTKKVLKVWPLTKLKDWAAAPKAFTLNFGEHADGVYSVQTLEGETMSRLIGGYIDIIIKNSSRESNVPLQDDASSEVVSATSILPGHATVVEYANGAGPQTGAVGNQSSPLRHLSGSNAGQPLTQEETNLSNAIHSVLTQIGSFMPEIQRVFEDRALADEMEMAAWHDGKFELHRQQFLTLVSNIASATAQLVLLTSVDPVDINYVGVEQAVAAVSTSLSQLMDNVKIFAYHLPDDLDLREKMLDACRNLMSSTTSMLNAALPENDADRSLLLQTVNELGLAAGNLLGLFADLSCDQTYQDELLALAYQVAQASRVMGCEVEHVASECEDMLIRQQVEKSAVASSTSGSELVSCTRVLAMCLPEEQAKSRLLEAAGHVMETCTAALHASENASYDSHLLDRVAGNSADVNHAVDAYIAKLNEGPQQARSNTNGELCEAILNALDQLKTTVSTTAVLKGMAVAGKAVSRLVSNLRDQAQDLDDPSFSNRLLDSARMLTEATARLLENIKYNSQDPSNEEETLESVEDVKEVVWAVAGDDYRKLLLARLETASRRACATSTQLTVMCAAVEGDITNDHRKGELKEAGRDVEDEVGSLGAALKNLTYNPERAQAQLRLLTTAPGLLQPGTQLVVLAKTTHAIVQRDDLAADLLAVSKNVVFALAELKSAINAFSEAGGLLNLDAAVETLHDLAEVVNEDVECVAKHAWNRQSSETLQASTAQLTDDARTVGASMAGLVGSAAKRDDVLTGQGARSVAEALTELVESSRNVAANCHDDRAGQQLLLSAVATSLSTSIGLLQAARDSVTGAGGEAGNRNLVAAAKAVQEALANVLGCLPHARRMDAAIDRLSTPAVVSDVVRSLQEAQHNFGDSASALNQAVANLLEAARSGDMSLAEAAQRLADDFLNMLNAAKSVDDSTPGTNATLMAHAQGISQAAARLLEASKKMMMVGALDSPSLLSALTDAARDVTLSMNSLLGLVLANKPGQKECETAERSIQENSSNLLLMGEPLSSDDYFTCQRVVQEKAMALNDSLNVITASLRNDELDRVQSEAPLVGTDVNVITKAAAQCALLAGGASPLSAPLYAIRVACQRLKEPRCEGRQLLAQATAINTQSAAVRQIALDMAAASQAADVKRFYMEAAKETTGLTAAVVQSVTKLASANNDANREACATKADALTSAIEQLVAFSLAPPGTAPPSGRMWVPVLDPARSLVSSSSAFLLAARDICKDPTMASDPDWHALTQHSRDVSNALRRLLGDIVIHAPGQRECDEAMQELRNEMLLVDQALVGAVSHTLKPVRDSTLETYHEQAMGALISVHENVEPLVVAAKTDPVELARQVTAASTPFNRLCQDVVGAASNTVDHNSQLAMLKCCKALMESMIQLVGSAKEAGGNPNVTQSHAALVSSSNVARSAIQQLSAELESASSSSGALTSMVEGVEEAMMTLEQPLSEKPGGSFQEYGDSIGQTARWMAGESQKLIAKSSSHPDALPGMMESLGSAYQSLVNDTRNAMAVTEENGVSLALCRSSKALGQSTTRLLLASSAVHGDPTNMDFKHGLAAAARSLSEKVSDLLSALQAGSRGVQACLEAIQELSGIISEIETNVLFVSAGTLIPDTKDDVFANHRDVMLGQTKALIDHIKQLVLGAATSSERLATEANAIVACSRDLAESSRAAAATLGTNDKPSQIALLDACKNVAGSLSDLLDISKNASGKPPTSPEMEHLRGGGKNIMQAIGKFMETVRNCDNESTRGIYALRDVCQKISHELDVLYEPVGPGVTASAEDLIYVSKRIPSATAKLQNAGRSRKRDDALVAAPIVQSSVVDLLTKCRAASAAADTPQARDHCLQAGQQCGEAFIAMMHHIIDILASPSPEKSKRLPEFSKDIALAVNAVVKAAELLKSGFVNPNDPNVIAEQELLAAAAAIEAASKKLSELKPRESARMADESLSFDEQIIEAAKAIALATSALIKWATATQRELVAQGRVTTSGSRYLQDDDGSWSDGLVSAAKMVAETTNQLCEAANMLVRGQASEEKLIAAARGVSQWTIQLLIACQVKADPDSDSASKLQDAGKAVERASANLVKAASEAARAADDDDAASVASSSGASLTAVQRIRATIELRERITAQERALADEYSKLEGMHRSHYDKAGTSKSKSARRPR